MSRRKLSPEMRAMFAIGRALDGLSEPERLRALAFFVSRYYREDAARLYGLASMVEAAQQAPVPEVKP